MALVGRLVPMDRLVGKDFEKGLARLKAAAEPAPEVGRRGSRCCSTAEVVTPRAPAPTA